MGGKYIYAGTINRTPTAANGLPKCCWRIAISLRTDCDNILNKLQQHNIQKTKTILLQCKNPLFARQKPYFYTAKTILLFCEHVTYTEWTRCKHSVNIYVHPRNSQRTLMKTPNLHSARRRGRFIVPVFFLCQIRIFTSSNTCIRFIANTFLFVILWIYTDMRAR